jgi:hypothetical protein
MKGKRLLVLAAIALAAIVGIFSPVGKANTVTDRDLSANHTVTSDYVGLSAPSHVKAVYKTRANRSGELLSEASEDITIHEGVRTEVPEPGALALVGIGLLAIGLLIRRRFST